LVLALSLASDTFLTVDNGLNVLRQISINLCLSIGMTLVILSGGIDLSVGSVLALSGAVAAGLLKNGITLAPINRLLSDWLGVTFTSLDVMLQFTALGAIVAGIAAGLAAGWVNGFVITRFRLPPFVATLGMLSIARGLTQLWTGNFPITNLGDEFRFMGTGYFLGVPMPVWVCAVLVLVFVVITRRTPFGRHLYAVGGNERAAMLSGLNVNRVERWVYTLCGGLAGVAGLLVTARLDAADPKVGIGYELDSIAAVVIGGTSLSGGRGSVLGTVLGCLIIGVLNNGLVLLGVSPDWQLVVKGAVILIAVAIDQAGRKET
jgi:ribose transport system permease protein